MTRTIQALLVLLAAYCYPALAETNYSKTVELPPLRISFLELQGVLNKGASLMSEANRSAPMWREEIELQRGELRVKITGHVIDSEGTKIPNSINSFEYTALAHDPTSISRLALSFHDYRRLLSVEGNSPEQVDAVFSVLREELSRMSTPIGGSLLKSFLGFPSIWLLLIVLIGLVGAWHETRRRIFLLPISICIVLLFMVPLLPIEDIFAGFSAVRGDASFMVRYGPEISFWGLAIGALAIPLSLVPMLFRGDQKVEETTLSNAPKRARQKRRAS